MPPTYAAAATCRYHRRVDSSVASTQPSSNTALKACADSFPALPAIACAAIVLLLMIWPSDIPWGGDELILIHHAIEANRQHMLQPFGLEGSFGFPYGPLPTQIYQTLLLISHRLPVVVQLHALLFGGTTAIALLWLARSLKWNPWLAPAAMLSPFFWFYGRLLWDNPFAIPLGTLMIAGYAAILRRRTWLNFSITCASTVALIFIHFMTLPLIAAVAAHAMIHQRRALLQHWTSAAVILILAIISSGTYCIEFAKLAIHHPHLAQSSAQGELPPMSRAAAFAFPLRAGRLLSAYDFFDHRGTEPGLDSSTAARWARNISAVAYSFVVLGIITGLLRLPAAFRGTDPADSVVGITVLALILQSLLDGILRIAPWPHYFCGTWIACVICMWFGVSQFSRVRCGRLRLDVVLLGVYAMATLLATALFAIGIHQSAGGTAWYGPTLARQLSDLVAH